jgi:hypothetical protein
MQSYRVRCQMQKSAGLPILSFPQASDFALHCVRWRGLSDWRNAAQRAGAMHSVVQPDGLVLNHA